MLSLQKPGPSSLRNLCALCVSVVSFFFALQANSNLSASASQEAAPRRSQSQEEATGKSSAAPPATLRLMNPTMHPTRAVHIGLHRLSRRELFDFHYTRRRPQIPPNTIPPKEKAHVQPRDPSFKNRSALPERTYTKWLKESAEYIKFVNPGDLRVAAETCGDVGCHAAETRAVSTSMMTHAGFLWGAALYNNGSYPRKNTRFGESYNREGNPQSIKTSPKPTPEETRTKGVLPELDPLYRWETSQPGNVLRVFERGGRKKPRLAIRIAKRNPQAR